MFALVAFEAGDDRGEVVGGAGVHFGEPSLAVLFGAFDDVECELKVVAVLGQELGCGDEDGAAQTSVGVRAALLQREAAVSVGQGHGGPGEVLFGPRRISKGAVFGNGDGVAVNVDFAGFSQCLRTVLSCSRA